MNDINISWLTERGIKNKTAQLCSPVPAVFWLIKLSDKTCPPLSQEQVAFLANRVKNNEDLISCFLSFIRHETSGNYVSIESLAKDIGKSRSLAMRVFSLLDGMMLIDYSVDGMPRRYSAVLNENGRRVAINLIKDETNPDGVIEIVGKEVRRVEKV